MKVKEQLLELFQIECSKAASKTCFDLPSMKGKPYLLLQGSSSPVTMLGAFFSRSEEGRSKDEIRAALVEYDENTIAVVTHIPFTEFAKNKLFPNHSLIFLSVTKDLLEEKSLIQAKTTLVNSLT